MSIAIPDSCLIDAQTLFDKSSKIAQIARACSIFRVQRIFVYHDNSVDIHKEDPTILRIIFEYLDTPPYLRKKIFPRMEILKYAGTFPPIKSPHHKPKVKLNEINNDDVRLGIVTKRDGKTLVDVGLEKMLYLEGDIKERRKVFVKIKKIKNEIRCIEVQKSSLWGYWGYDVLFTQSLKNLLATRKNETIITSRTGRLFDEKNILSDKSKLINSFLLVFGSPKNGVKKILEYENVDISTFPMVYNMFPHQGTDTVRLEEAIMGALSIINHFLVSKN